MIRLYLTVEGQTEQQFAVKVLQPHLAMFGVYVTKPRLTGLHPRTRGRVPRGGLLDTFRHTLADIRRWLSEDKSPEARFSTMIDLYGLPSDFPGYADAKRLNGGHAQAKKLEESLTRELNDPRFIPNIQVHEFEAIVLTKPDAFSEWFDAAENAIKALKKDCNPFETPEHVNGGHQTHPKARIRKHFPDYVANVDGPALAQRIGLSEIKASCPHVSEWLHTLEQLDRLRDSS